MDHMREVPDRSSAASSRSGIDRIASGAESIAEKAGYRPELRRTLGFFSMFALAFSIISITAGIFLSFGFGLAHWGPASIWTWPIVGVGNLMVAFIVAELGTRIPLAGYAYQWTARLMSPTYGWFVGFAALLNMTVAGGAIALLAASPLILSEFNVTGDHPHLVLAVAVMFLALPVVFNIISIQLAVRVNNLAVFTEILGTVVFGVLLFVLWGLQTEHTPYGYRILTSTAAPSNDPAWYSFVLAGLLGAFTLVGFELSATFSEDAVDPGRSVPRGVVWAVTSSAVLGMVALIGFTVAIPSIRAVEHSGLPLLTIAEFWLPYWVVKVFIGFVIFSMFALVVVGSGAQARLAYSMARDNMIPFSRQLKKVHPKTRTPIVALLVFLAIDVGVMWYGYLQANTYGTLVGATSIIPYLMYFLITVAYAVKRRATDGLPGAFDLGRWAWPVIVFVLLYTVAVMVALSAPVAFRGSDKFLGYGLGLALVWYFSVLVWRLQRGTAGVRPIEELADC
jgi:amino acid transporter